MVGAKGLVIEACCNLLHSFLLSLSNDAFFDVDEITGTVPGSFVDASPFERMALDVKVVSITVLVAVADDSWFSEGCDELLGEDSVLPPSLGGSLTVMM